MKVLEVSKEDLKYNLNIIKEKAGDTKIIAIVKANGMGFGLIQYSKFLIDNGIEMLAVANLDEALSLREAKVNADILMLSEVFDEEEIEKLISNNIILSIGSLEEKEKIAKICEKINTKAKIHVKIDTGFGRYGFLYTEEDKIYDALKSSDMIDVSRNIYTSF